MPSNRSIFFYTMRFCRDEECSSVDSPDLLYKLVEYYNRLRDHDISSLFYRLDQRREIYMGIFSRETIVHKGSNISIVKGKIGYCLTELPEGERKGQIIERIQVEPKGTRIYIPSHFIIFDLILQDSRALVLGMEYNSLGPRHGKLAKYLTYLLRKMMCGNNLDNCRNQYVVEIVPMYNKDLRSLINTLVKLKFLYIKVKASYLEEVESRGRLLSLLLGQLNNIRETGSKTITLELDSGKSRSRFIEVIEPIDIIHLLNELSADAFVKIRLRAINRDGDYIKINDLLSKFIKNDVEVEYEDNLTRRVNSNAMFNAISMSFKKLFESILKNAFL